jgi:phosphoglycolate phosphatase
MSHPQAVIFDMDGTLLDTLEDLGASMNRVLEREGLATHPIGAYRFFVGDGATMLAQRVLPAGLRRSPVVQRVRDAWSEEYDRHWADKTRLYPGIGDLLDVLAERRVPMAVLSNKPHAFTVQMAKHFLGRWPFGPVLGAREGAPRKPDPETALEIARGWDLPPEAVLYAGDTNTDMETARRAGMFAVGVLWGFREREELESSGALALAARPLELLSHLAH